jgi:hypothetical protein
MGYYSRFEIEQRATPVAEELVIKELISITHGLDFEDNGGQIVSSDDYNWTCKELVEK